MYYHTTLKKLKFNCCLDSSQFKRFETQCNQFSFADRTQDISFKQFEKKNRIYCSHLHLECPRTTSTLSLS